MKDFLADIGSNRRIAAGMLLAECKVPWRDLAEPSVRARAFGAGKVNLSSNSELWTLRESNSHLLIVPITLVDPARIELASPHCK